ncbi:tetratricopeptide repeat protein [Seongchinamella unica]|uniref:Tetratricopeptide repeat protein n=1 Tax=Seongchinamella unica TaxID=2547392 RepID=A0A4R5LR54_9GAMM|nr:tetratricopeptide repeat protein [Seongchinamella unica]TDG13355.1 tetratricopeptide repeat protein [Seongchinamella unica]
MATFFTELKRRHVFKVAAAYVVTGWIVAQAAEFLLESFTAPEWILQALIIVLALGFPIAIVLAWAFELTPDGVQRDSADEEQTLAEITGLPAELAVEIPGQSIAVLPFADMSPDRDQEYFSDGLTEELLNLLAKVPGLHVASRTSAFSFKGRQEDIREIAEKLRVRHVLEGSVRKAGDQLRITAQLIKAQDGYHLWSENYDRSMANVFAIQDEIARAVVESLKPQLLDKIPVARETSSEAYNLYLQALHCKRQRTPDSLNQAMDYLEQAVDIDPDYAPAWALLSLVYALRGGSAQAGWEEGVAASRKALERALELDSEHAGGWISQSQLRSYYEWDWAGAHSDLERARALAPDNSDVYVAEARLARSEGRLEDSVAFCDQAIALDPLNQDARSDRARALYYLGKLDESEAAFHSLMALNANHHNAFCFLCRIQAARGEVDEALQEQRTANIHFWTDFNWLLIAYQHRRSEECEAKLARFIAANGEDGAFQIAEIFAAAGEADSAFKWLETAVRRRDPGLTDELLSTETLRSLHNDPRWEPLVEKLGLLEAYRRMPVRESWPDLD